MKLTPMELTPEEARLINALREIDRVNPIGVDGYTTDAFLTPDIHIAESAAREAKRRYLLFQEQRKTGGIIDLKEVQRPKATREDPRISAEEKEIYAKLLQS